jgi:hypothetical protein
VNPPLVSAVRLDGLYPNDTWSGPKVTWIRRRCVAGRLLALVTSDDRLFRRAQTIVARTNRGSLTRVRFEPNARTVVKVPLAPGADGTCRVDFTVTPTAVPSQVSPGLSTDRRVLGAHFNRFLYRRGAGR